MHFHKIKLSTIATAAALAVASVSATAATFDRADFGKLSAQASTNGSVPVMVHLLPVSLQQLQYDTSALKASIADRKAKLLAELGAEAKSGVRWDNSIGQIGLYVTPAGLKILSNSANASGVFQGNDWWQGAKFAGADGRHQAITSLIAAQGYADVVVTLDVEGPSAVAPVAAVQVLAQSSAASTVSSPASLSATQGVSPDSVSVTVSFSGQPACAGGNVLVVTRQGVEIGRASLPASAPFNATYVDATPVPGHAYTYIAYVTHPVCGTSSNLTATGFAGVSDGSVGASMPPASITASDGTVPGRVDLAIALGREFAVIGCPMQYQIFRDDTLIASVPANATLVYQDLAPPAGPHVYSARITAPGNVFSGPTPCGTSKLVSDPGRAG